MEMANQNKHIPEHLRERWDSVNAKLGEVTLKLVQANEEYHDVIAERLAMTEELKEWQMQTYFNK